MDNSRHTERTRGAHRTGLIIAIAMAVVGIVVMSQLVMDAGPLRSSWASLARSVVPASGHARSLKTLEGALAKEVRARIALTDRVSELESQISPLNLRGDEFPVNLHERIESSSVFDDLELGETQPATQGNVSRFDDAALSSLGVDPHDATRLRDLWVRYELDRAELLDRSLREGWFLSDRRQWEMGNLEQAFRDDLQDDEYDHYLYALGKLNRVSVGEVFDGSRASEAGIRHGDVILRYDDTRIFRPVDLLLTSSRGVPDQSVPVEILRNGRRQTVYVSRGPLGVLTEHDRGIPLSD